MPGCKPGRDRRHRHLPQGVLRRKISWSALSHEARLRQPAGCLLRVAVSERDPREPTPVGFASGASETRGVRPRDGLLLWVRSSHDVDANAAVPGCCSRTRAAAVGPAGRAVAAGSFARYPPRLLGPRRARGCFHAKASVESGAVRMSSFSGDAYAPTRLTLATPSFRVLSRTECVARRNREGCLPGAKRQG